LNVIALLDSISNLKCIKEGVVIYNNNNNIQNDVVLVPLIYNFHFELNEIDFYSYYYY